MSPSDVTKRAARVINDTLGGGMDHHASIAAHKLAEAGLLTVDAGPVISEAPKLARRIGAALAAAGRCENSVGTSLMTCQSDNSGRDPLSPYDADGYCTPCRVNAALAGETVATPEPRHPGLSPHTTEH